MAFDILVKNGGTSVRDFITALLKPLQTVSDATELFEAEYNDRAHYNGQVIVLSAALNNIFGVSGIYIETNRDISTNLYFYEESELSPVFFFEASENDPVYFFEASEITSDFDFTVFIPIGIYTAELDRRVRAETQLYKVAGTRFNIDTY